VRMAPRDHGGEEAVVSQPDRERRVSEAFVALADTLVDDYDVIDLLDQLVAHCVALLAADAAGLLLRDARRQLRVAAASSDDAQTMELLQMQAEEGPCVEAYRSVTQVRIPDLAAVADRWPRWVAAVTEFGAFASVHAIPLRLRGQAIGALNLFHHNPGPLPESDLALAQALADVATIGILSERAIRRGEIVNEQLQTALNSRVIIEQAKGVLSQKLDVKMDEAFDRLRRYSRANNLRLAEVARRTVEGELDTDVLRAPKRSSAAGSS
jgi:GAF domain-containing protein